MPKFVVRKSHDAFVHYETVVEVDTPQEACLHARSHDYDGEWFATGEVSEFDDHEIDETDGVRPLEDGETIEGCITLAVTAQERDAVLAGLRVLQAGLRLGAFPQPVLEVLTNDASHSGLDPDAIDGLCERINI